MRYGQNFCLKLFLIGLSPSFFFLDRVDLATQTLYTLILDKQRIEKRETGEDGNPNSICLKSKPCFHFRNLRDMDMFSKSDPLCVVSTKPFGSQSWSEIKRTECVQNNLNPQWVTKIQMNYLFEEQQHLKFDVYDVDNNSKNLQEHDFLGSGSVTLGQVVSSGSIVLDLIHPEYMKGTCGSVMVSCEELSMCKDELEVQFLGKKLDKKDWFGSSDPFLVFKRSNESGSFTIVHKTEHIRNNINPMWQKFVIPVRTLCNGDLDRNIKIECYDHNNNGSHSLIGEFYATVRQFLEGPGPENEFDCINPKKKVNYSRFNPRSVIRQLFFQPVK